MCNQKKKNLPFFNNSVFPWCQFPKFFHSSVFLAGLVFCPDQQSLCKILSPEPAGLHGERRWVVEDVWVSPLCCALLNLGFYRFVHTKHKWVQFILMLNTNRQRRYPSQFVSVLKQNDLQVVSVLIDTFSVPLDNLEVRQSTLGDEVGAARVDCVHQVVGLHWRLLSHTYKNSSKGERRGVGPKRKGWGGNCSTISSGKGARLGV